MSTSIQRQQGKSLEHDGQDDTDADAPSSRAEEPTTTNNPFPIPSEVLRILARSDLLPPSDLGRTLLLTTPAVMGSVLSRDEIWSNLCRSRWGDVFSDLASLDTIRERGWEWLFRRLSAGVAKKTTEIHPPTTSAADYMLLISVYDGGGDTVVAKVIQGEDILPLFQSSELCFDIDPIFVPKIGTRDGPHLKWSATAHLLRTTDHKCCCVFESKYADWMGDRYEPDRSKALVVDALVFERTNRYLDMEESWTALMRRHRRIYYHAIQDVCFEMNLGLYWQETPGKGGQESTVELLLKGLTISCWEQDDEGENEELFEERNGVTLTHIVEQLSGWDEGS